MEHIKSTSMPVRPCVSSVCFSYQEDAILLNHQCGAICHRDMADGDSKPEYLCLHNPVYRSPDEAGHTFDYIVCAHKAIDPSAIPPIFHSVADTYTTFVVMQNGVGNEDPFRASYPKCTIISGVIWVGATQTSPGLIKHMQAENTEIGLFPNPGTSPDQEQGKLEQFAAMMRQGGTNISIEQNVQTKRWEKVVWNVAWNSIGELL
jgi:ketopantoate reductase